MQTPYTTVTLPTFNKGACYMKMLLPVMRTVHAVRAWCDFSTLPAVCTLR